MNKNDLKTGYLVQYRDGEFRRVFMDDTDPDKCILIDVKCGTFNYLKRYNDSLQSEGKIRSRLDIVKVFAPKSPPALRYSDNSEHKLLWERDIELEKYHDLDLVEELQSRGWNVTD